MLKVISYFKKGLTSEKNISTKCSSKSQKTWFPAANVNKRRPSHYKGKTAAWKAKTVSVIGRVKGRDRHTALLRRGIRTKKGPIELVYLSEKTDKPSLAFAIPKIVGKAVTRNRIRRQLREEFTKIVARESKNFLEGNYLIKVHSAEILNINELLEEAIKDLKLQHERN